MYLYIYEGRQVLKYTRQRYVYKYTYMYICMYTYTFMFACINMRIYGPCSVGTQYLCIYTHEKTHTHTHIYINTHTHTHTYI